MRHPTSDLTAFADGALSPARRLEVERHLASCEACRAEEKRLSHALRVLASLPPAPEPSPFFGTRLMSRLADEPLPGKRGGIAQLFPRWRIAFPVGAVATVLAVAVFIVRARDAHEQEFTKNLQLFENYEVVANLDTLSSPEDAVIAANIDAIEPSGGRR